MSKRKGEKTMHTLHDFMLVTKGQEYLIAVTFLLLFCIFWAVLDKKKKRHAD